jgi:urease accessory protein
MTFQNVSAMKKLAPLLAVLSLAPTLAHAHTGGGDAHGLVHGFQHPLFGLDHLLAMVAIGLWAAQLGGRALWAVPATFVSVMAVGGMLGIAGVPVPMVEPGIATSVLLLGLLIALSVRMPLAFSIPLVSVFAIFHGYAHGAEMPADASGVAYAAGFLVATAALHCGGIALGMAIQRLSKASTLRIAGAAIAVAGAALFF